MSRCLLPVTQSRIRTAVKARTARRDYEVLFKGMKAKQLAGQVRLPTGWGCWRGVIVYSWPPFAVTAPPAYFETTTPPHVSGLVASKF